VQSLEQLSTFIANAPHDPASVWRREDLRALAGRVIPDAIFDRNEAVLKADAHVLWLRWFLEGVCNPLRYVDDETKTIVDVHLDTLDRVNRLYPGAPQPERLQLAQQISRHVMSEVERRRRLARTYATTAQRRELVDNEDGKPRCWMCGYLFSTVAVDRFLRKSKVELDLPKFVDIFRPRGLIKRDIGIEVEHIVPVAGGGGGMDNLALACGWCNASKGARTSIYDARARSPRAPFSLGGDQLHELPQPFWSVRLMAFRRTCEHLDGCTASVDNAELFLSPSDPRGSLNPSNLRVVCAAHDPYAAYRFFGREAARKVWQERVRG
jgi:5-methylcytosine-specific restriction endonuclease McrA